MAWYIENDIPGVLYNGLNTQKAVDFSGASSVTLKGGTSVSGALQIAGALTGVTTISASSTAALVTGTSLTSGGVTGITLGTSSAIGIYWGSSTPTVAAGKGSLYLRSDGSSAGTRMFVNSDGNTAWVAVTTAS